MPLHSSAERANDNGPENETSSPNQQKHPTGLSSRDCVLGQPSYILWKVFYSDLLQNWGNKNLLG